nr:coiled-coil and C2 domain-containing protein 1A-like [Columba livia]
MGLLVELSPEGTAGDTAGDPAAELEAELLALVGAPAAPGAKAAAKAALPLEALERMAALCLRDQDDEDDEELGDEADLMAELQEVLGDGDGDAPAPPGKVRCSFWPLLSLFLHFLSKKRRLYGTNRPPKRPKRP